MAVREDLSDVNNGRYSNILLFLAVGVLLYILVRGWQKAKQQALSDNIGGNTNGQLAQRLRTAFIPSGFPVSMGFDGTDVPAVMIAAGEIKDYPAVAAAYRTLYNSDLTNDLSEELSVGDLATFWKIVNGKGTATTTTTGTPKTGTTTVTIGTETRVTALAGKVAVATQSVNVRLYKEPQYSESVAAKGQNVGTYVGEADITINGTKGRFVHIRKPALFSLYNVDYWVHKGSLTFI